MIISRTPLRISLVGGGTDLPEFYQANEYGAVVSFAINWRITACLNKRFTDEVRASYSQTEIVKNILDLKHDIIRACLLRMKIDKGIEINTIADIPSKGTGLGSSSSLIVGLLNALTQYAIYYDIPFEPIEDVAEEAFLIESAFLNKKLGKQDHYAAAYGGLNYLRFNADDSVEIKPLPNYREFYEKIERRICLFYTGITRSSQEILQEQSELIETMPGINADLSTMKNLADQVYGELLTEQFDNVGELLDKNWSLKRRLVSGITNEHIDHWYQIGKDAGALGGKICGAGGGGFILFWCKPEDKENIQNAIPLRYIPIQINRNGTRIVYMDGFND